MSFNCPKPRPHCNHCDMDGHDDTNCWYPDEATKVSTPAPAASSNPAAANFLADILGADFDDTEELPAAHSAETTVPAETFAYEEIEASTIEWEDTEPLADFGIKETTALIGEEKSVNKTEVENNRH